MMGHEPSFRSKAAHFVSDVTTVLLNPISDKPHKTHEDKTDLTSQQESVTEGDSGSVMEGPDTSSFSAFLVSLLSSSESEKHSDEENEYHSNMGELSSDLGTRGTARRKSLISFGKQSLRRAIYQAARLNGYRDRSLDKKVNCDMGRDERNDSKHVGVELKPLQTSKETASQITLPDISEPSLLLTKKTRSSLYVALPALVHGRKWVLLYSTWRHGISLSTLYRRSIICPGYCLLVVGDRKGAVFGGLVEAPLRPTNKRKYQGTNNTFVFTDASSDLVVFLPTGANRYFTLCSTDFLALGGGGHFALYLDGDLLNGSSSASETFGNSCLARSQDFEVKEVELWGFANASKYEEIVALTRTEAPGICRW